MTLKQVMGRRAIEGLFLAVIAILKVMAEQEKLDQATAAVSTPCDEARYHNVLAAQTARAFGDVQTTVANTAKLSIAYRIAAEAASSKSRRTALTALSIRAAATVADTMSKAHQLQTQYLTAIGLLKARVAQLRALHKLTPTNTVLSETSKGQGATEYTATGLFTCTSTVTLTAETEGNCSLETETAGQINDSNVNLQTATHLKLLPDDKIQLTKFKLIAAAKDSDSVTHAATSHQGICTENGNRANPSAANNVIAGVLQVTKHDANPQKTQLFAANNAGECQAAARDSTWREDSAANLVQTLCELKKVETIGSRRYHQENAAQFVGDSELLTILSDLVSPGSKVPDKEQEKKALIYKFFPQDPATFKTEITDAVEKTEISITIREKPIKGTPIALAGTADGAEVLAYYLGKELAERTQEKSSASKHAVAKEQSDKCTAITDKEKCKTEDGCELKGEKCVAKTTIEGVVTGSQNTTGSNSFVINKVLLTLAFFISIINFQKNIL
uniref:Variant surface glycoprotein 1125.537 n=1 Tax=Trypanosoma brucei TaxID=5691 RepID=A0A1J0R631_9TRYP|nr:variant surface glycoprotein 1125.537 [Trypanosoma brucei]